MTHEEIIRRTEAVLKTNSGKAGDETSTGGRIKMIVIVRPPMLQNPSPDPILTMLRAGRHLEHPRRCHALATALGPRPAVRRPFAC